MLIATLVLCLPVFFAGIVFINSFAVEKFSGQALGSNLFGGLVGGLLESLSYSASDPAWCSLACSIWPRYYLYVGQSTPAVRVEESVISIEA